MALGNMSSVWSINGKVYEERLAQFVDHDSEQSLPNATDVAERQGGGGMITICLTPWPNLGTFSISKQYLYRHQKVPVTLYFFHSPVTTTIPPLWNGIAGTFKNFSNFLEKFKMFLTKNSIFFERVKKLKKHKQKFSRKTIP